MIAYLKGNLMTKSEEYIILEVQGIGYKVYMSKKSIDELAEEGQVKVYTYLKLREDDISLFGFSTNEELHMFELLISVGGIGAKSAITILSNVTPSRFALAVITNDVNSLTCIVKDSFSFSCVVIFALTFSLLMLKLPNVAPQKILSTNVNKNAITEKL